MGVPVPTASRGQNGDQELSLSTHVSSPAQFDSSSSRQRHGLRLVDERLPAQRRNRAAARAAFLPSLAALSLFDRLVVLGFAIFVLSYVAGVGLGLGWALRRVFGA